ncbi:MAG: tRNA (adenosine(37)-N6)-threonylcarbamoyltransferase complex dimerization subunit type 1 TsaB [Candidatus Acidiferrales bacterium]
MLIFALDTSSPGGSVAVLRDQRVIGAVSTWTDEIYSSRMFRHVEFLLRELSLSLDQFDLFAVTAGPGSFTGLRVGLATVKAWAEVYNKPIAAINVLEAIAAQSHTSPAKVLVSVLDARRGQVYFAFYRKQDALLLDVQGNANVMTPEEFLEAVDARAGTEEFAIVISTPAAISSALARFTAVRDPNRQIIVEQVSSVLAPVVGQLGYFRAQRGSLTDALSLDANYVRRTDAELHWKQP